MTRVQVPVQVSPTDRHLFQELGMGPRLCIHALTAQPLWCDYC